MVLWCDKWIYMRILHHSSHAICIEIHELHLAHTICEKCFAGGTEVPTVYRQQGSSLLEQSKSTSLKHMHCAVLERKVFLYIYKGGNKAKWELHFVYCRNVKSLRWNPRSALTALSQRPLSGPNSAVFGKKYAGSTFASLSFSWHFYPKSTLITGTIHLEKPGVKYLAQRCNYDHLWIAPCGIHTYKLLFITLQ